jgi:pimeloyl-ACP methyl ester carboxylesterase
MPTPPKKLPVPGEVFSLEGRTAFLILPARRAGAGPAPWVWYAPTLEAYPGPEEQWMFERFLAAGLAVAGVDVGESCGSPAGRAGFSALYAELTGNRGFSTRPCLLARSRGGLMHYNWAAEHPEAVACIAGVYPVCDLRSYPGLAKAASAYGLAEAGLAAALPAHNPVDRLEPLARAGVPVFHIHGDNDTAVPLETNSGELARRYRALGGQMTLKLVPGGGHDMSPGWFQCQELVDFVVARCATG